MAEQLRRDFQMFNRTERCRATVAKCSALGMEIKRKKVRETAVFLESEDDCLQEKIDFELRIREGICKLLVVSTQKEQVLNAVKNLMTCNARILAYMSALQNQRQDQMEAQAGRRSSDIGTKERAACAGKVAISDIRIPLLWKNSDHFSNKESCQRYAVFCMLKMGTTVFDTDLALVDKTMTDISFEKATIFNDARPDFEIKLEVYSCCVEESFSSNTPKKLVQRLRRSFGKSVAKSLSFHLDGPSPENVALFNPPNGAKFSMLAHSTITLESAENSFSTRSLIVTGHEEASFWLPLYGNMCCCVVAQPAFMTEDVNAGFLNQKQVGNVCSLKRIFCVLRGFHLLCYYSPEEIDDKIEPFMKVPVNKETRIRAMDKDSSKRSNSFSVINPVSGEAMTQIFAADSRDELQRWMEAFWQQFFNLSQWKYCSECLDLRISPQNPPLFLTKEATSVYHDMSIGSPMKFESLADIIYKKNEETDGQFLTCSKEVTNPPWTAMFDSSRQMHAQKFVLADEHEKKRRAPVPSSEIPPFLSQETTYQSEKENICSNANFTPFFDANKSVLTQPSKGTKVSFLKAALPSKICKTQDGSVHKGAEIHTKDKPVPLPRIRSLKGKKKP
ncbi:rhotekin-2 isoform X1 [Pleurodeles waltl]|uniref:rhotekin-2 isoform X1 n=1 Tax=Pleurodeles waltl TaxID=8319 RepID=UPI0037098A77